MLEDIRCLSAFFICAITYIAPDLRSGKHWRRYMHAAAGAAHQGGHRQACPGGITMSRSSRNTREIADGTIEPRSQLGARIVVGLETLVDQPMKRLVCRCSAYAYPHAFNSGLCTYTTATGTVLARGLCLSGCAHYRRVVGTPGYCRVLSAEEEYCPALPAVVYGEAGTVFMASTVNEPAFRTPE
jgi:hypothetical protein